MYFCSSCASIPHEPIGSRIADAVAEDGIETEAGLVDEIVHVAFDRAVVIAEEHHPLFAVEKHPAREVNRAYASQAAAPDEMPRRVIDGRENADQRQEPHDARFQASHRGELIGDVVILEARQRVGVGLIHAPAQFGIGFLQAAKPNEKDRRDQR